MWCTIGERCAFRCSTVGQGKWPYGEKSGRRLVEITDVLNVVFLEREPVDELLMDSSTVFCSEMLERWSIRRLFRTVYKPSGNGIVKWHHCTIKVTTESGWSSPMEAIFWYNVSPRIELFLRTGGSLFKKYSTVHSFAVEHSMEGPLSSSNPSFIQSSSKLYSCRANRQTSWSWYQFHFPKSQSRTRSYSGTNEDTWAWCYNR